MIRRPPVLADRATTPSAPGALYELDNVGGQALEITTETRQRIGVDALGAPIDDFSDVQIGVGG